MSMTDSTGGAPQGAAGGSAGVEISESWASEPIPSSSGDDPAGNQEHWSGRMPPQDSDAEQSVLG